MINYKTAQNVIDIEIKALKLLKKSIDQDRIVIGEKDEYKALCRVCFYNKKKL